MTVIILILGILFGLTLQYASLNKYNTISGMATLENLSVAKAIAVAIGVGAILVNIEIGLGLAYWGTVPEHWLFLWAKEHWMPSQVLLELYLEVWLIRCCFLSLKEYWDLIWVRFRCRLQ